jgi:hypothetical protein
MFSVFTTTKTTSCSANIPILRWENDHTRVGTTGQRRTQSISSYSATCKMAH